jgi:D-glycero-D-manno-heptose 1,7-bisphosphate phosphatase
VTRAVFLDRDGVLNPPELRRGRWRAPATLPAFRPYPGAGAAVGALRRAGLVCLVVTNQPDVAAGELDPAALEAMHERLVREVGVDAVYVCPHAAADRCPCRKPRPGLLLQAAAEWDVDLHASFLVGDRPGDIEAGRTAGCRTVLVAGPESDGADPDYRAPDLEGAVTTILTLTGDGR